MFSKLLRVAVGLISSEFLEISRAGNGGMLGGGGGDGGMLGGGGGGGGGDGSSWKMVTSPTYEHDASVASTPYICRT